MTLLILYLAIGLVLAIGSLFYCYHKDAIKVVDLFYAVLFTVAWPVILLAVVFTMITDSLEEGGYNKVVLSKKFRSK